LEQATGATVGKFYGTEQAMKGGVGIAGNTLNNGLIVGALVAVNAFGDIKDPISGRILAGARKAKKSTEFADTLGLMRKGVQRPISAFQNTTIGVIVTNAKTNEAECFSCSEDSQQWPDKGYQSWEHYI